VEKYNKQFGDDIKNQDIVFVFSPLQRTFQTLRFVLKNIYGEEEFRKIEENYYKVVEKYKKLRDQDVKKLIQMIHK